MSAASAATIAAYLPRDRVERLLRPGSALPSEGVALIADISGFTPLTEALALRLSPDRGAEELTRALDSVFTPLIAEADAQRGSVIKFLGDAMIVWYGRAPRATPASAVRRALTSAWRMQAVMARLGRVTTPIGAAELTMKIGLAYGPARRFVVGLPEHGYQDVLCGSTLDLMSAAEHAAGPGEILLDAATAGLAPGVVETEPRGAFAVVRRLLRPARARPWPPLAVPEGDQAAERALAPYIPQQVYRSLAAGLEHIAALKPIVCVFVLFEGIDYDGDPLAGERLQTYAVTAQQVVARYGGFLIRINAGDKGSMLHIIFGAPQTVEEQAERAVRCALDLRRECGGLPFIAAQRIGITGGRAFAGPLGAPGRQDYTTMGDSINLAARLMQRAAPGQILLDGAVRAQLGDSIALEHLGLARVKGKAQPVAVFAALDAGPARRAAGRAPLFGRDAERAAARQRIEALARGQGGVVVLVGEAGAGKTLLLDTLRAESDAPWAAGVGQAYGHALAGGLIADALRDMLGLPLDERVDAAGRLREQCAGLLGAGRAASAYPYLARLLGLRLTGDDARRLEGLAGESLRWQITGVLVELLRAVLGRGPLVLALDDVQWADPTSLYLLRALLPLCADHPLLLIMALRPERESPAWALRAELLREEPRIAAVDITLSRLSEAAAARLVSHYAPGLPEATAARLIEKSGGNPLFLVELLRTLRAARAGAPHDAIDDIDLPDTVQGLLLAQIDRLPVETRHVLQVAAVIGPTFQRRVLGRVLGGEPQLAAALAALEGEAFIRPVGRAVDEPAYAFAHRLLQESAYSTLLYERRRAHHGAAARALEQLYPARLAEQAGLLAMHYERADQPEAAIYYLVQAADQERLLFANAEAEARYRHALALMADRGEDDALRERRAQTYLKIAQLRANLLDFAGAQEHYDRAFALLDEGERPSPRGRRDAGAAGRTIRLGVFAHGPRTLDPGLSEHEDASEIIRDLFEGLVELDADLNIVPALARRWEVDESGRRYRFELREGLRWSDGAPLTAHDFVFAWRRNLDPSTGAALAGQLFVVAGAEAYNAGELADPACVGIRALDDARLEIELAQPVAYFPYVLSVPIAFPQPAHRVRALGAAWSSPENLVCNGPFQIAGWQAGEAIRLTRNPHYRGGARGNIEDALLRFVEPSRAAYASGEVDWCRVENAQPAPGEEDALSLIQYVQTCFLGFAASHPPFDKREVRQAFAACIDQEELVRLVLANVQHPATGGLVPPIIPGHSPEIGRRFDPAAGRALLRQAGYASGADLPPIALGTLPAAMDIPRYLCARWREHLGVTVESRANVLIEDLIGGLADRSIQIAMLTWDGDYPDPDCFLRVVFHSASPLNCFGWASPRFDALVDQAAVCADQAARLELYHQADRLLVAEECAVVPLFYYQAFGLLRPRFRLAGGGKILRGSMFKLKNIVALEEGR